MHASQPQWEREARYKKLQIIALSILFQNKPKYNAKCQDSDYSSKGILTKKGNKETFWNDESILNLDLGSVYMDFDICKKII